MVRFTLFGVPVEIQPWFWISGALLGGATSAHTPDAILAVLIFMVIELISLLVHEFGHALVGRRLGGGHASIVLWAFGGLAYNQGGRFTRSGNFWRVAAGPGAGLVLALLTVGGLCVAFGTTDAIHLSAFILFGHVHWTPSLEILDFIQEKTFPFLITRNLLWINFWWSVINLLPVLPLDGGRIADIFVYPQRRVYLIGVITGGAMAAYAWLGMNSTYTAVLFGYLAYKNYVNMTASHWR